MKTKEQFASVTTSYSRRHGNHWEKTKSTYQSKEENNNCITMYTTIVHKLQQFIFRCYEYCNVVVVKRADYSVIKQCTNFLTKASFVFYHFIVSVVDLLTIYHLHEIHHNISQYISLLLYDQKEKMAGQISVMAGLNMHVVLIG